MPRGTILGLIAFKGPDSMRVRALSHLSLDRYW
jgi:hypothetical protein